MKRCKGWRFSNTYIASPPSQLILQPFRRFTYVTASSTALPLLHLRHGSFSNLPPLHLRHSSFSKSYIASPTSQVILQPFRCFTYVTGTSPTSQLILQPCRRFLYATAHSRTLSPLHLRHHTFSKHSFASPTLQLILQPSAASSTPQLILQPFRRFTYVTGHSTTLPLLHLRHRHFMYFTWRAAHA